MSLIRRIARLLRTWKNQPRFGTPGLGLALVLMIAAVVLLLLASGPKTAPTPPRSTQPAPRVPEPRAPEPVPSPAPEPAAVEGKCPKGCDVPPPDCYIKGNVSKKGERIYHVPGQRYYEETVISPGKDEAWFCTEEEARANGWRRAKV